MINRTLVGAMALVALVGTSGRAAAADVCIQGAELYRLSIGTATPVAGTPIVVTGTILGTDIHVSGALNVSGSNVRFRFMEMFDWGSGFWINPVGTTVLTLNSSTGSMTYDTTFHGNGDPPSTFTGPASFIACPASAAASSGTHPNAKAK